MSEATVLELDPRARVVTDAPAVPASLEATGVSPTVIQDLTLRHLQRTAAIAMADLAVRLALPVPLVEAVLAALRADKLIEIRRRGTFDGDVTFELTDAGRQRAQDAWRRSQYLGPAPVSLDQYRKQVARQQRQRAVTRDQLRAALAGLVIGEPLAEQLGAAMNSRKPLFLFGPSGSGKTVLAEQLVRVIGGAVWVPHAIEIDGEIVQVFDPNVHQPLPAAAEARSLDRSRQPDARWISCRRPVVRVGGEFTLEMMDLEFDRVARFYKCPLQVKANNGVLIVDDLGRQRSPARDILNRWIVPLERQLDYLGLHTGVSFEVPFDVQVIFSSNLTPAELDDPAFLRRLGYKVPVGAMTAADYRKVCAIAAQANGMEPDAAAIDYLIGALHVRHGVPLLAAYPRDLFAKVRDRAVFDQVAARLTPKALEWAWQLYFASDADAAGRD